MKSVVVVGAQWGDEGKGKVVDYLAGSFDYIVRVAGGHNAGHTVIIGKDRYVLQLIPCGILRPKQHAVIGSRRGHRSRALWSPKSKPSPRLESKSKAASTSAIAPT